MADSLFQLAPVQQRRPRSYGFNANLLNYSDEEHRARYRRVSMGLTVSRKRAKYLAVRRKN